MIVLCLRSVLVYGDDGDDDNDDDDDDSDDDDDDDDIPSNGTVAYNVPLTHCTIEYFQNNDSSFSLIFPNRSSHSFSHA